ncbi:hypothetical protein PMAYCL1PPCAC_31039 [Pristionchus mayeri]|uniref:Smr domain-containing protein n=1 Tax=Pristionchus mayeri TaxID=1317129 RepID=A0AAN5DD03_9BILA|nr:hypothetical protein PMAYCL1PPCAC_31039 [Pristionchus mayeri]
MFQRNMERQRGIMTTDDYMRAFAFLHQHQKETTLLTMIDLHNFYNSYLDPEFIDLHYLPLELVNLLLIIFLERIKEIRERVKDIEGKARPFRELHVITGCGRHNKAQSNRIRDKVETLAKKNGLIIKPTANPGVQTIKFSADFFASGAKPFIF